MPRGDDHMDDPGAEQRPVDERSTALVRIADLVLTGSPRLSGEDEDHISLLALVDAEALPPILVHRSTMRVIDGMHRVRAAILRGERTIKAGFFDGKEQAAFVLAVERNITHGLPLSLTDRKAAAAQIIRTHPHWSDRAIAACSGLSGRTVRSIRTRSTADLPQSDGRVGRDGRSRPLSVAEGRMRASAIMAAWPSAPLRKVAEAAGVSLGTAHDVRERMRRGDDPVPPRQRAGATPQADRVPPRPAREVPQENLRDPRSALENLKNDPSLKFSDAGRSVLRWLHAHAIGPDCWRAVLDDIPPHCAEVVAELARTSADAWQEFARQLEHRDYLAG